MLKQVNQQKKGIINGQPPSGGCVLKRRVLRALCKIKNAATFGWLCVETINHIHAFREGNAATFGWLCVETRMETSSINADPGSHLRVAVC